MSFSFKKILWLQNDIIMCFSSAKLNRIKSQANVWRVSCQANVWRVSCQACSVWGYVSPPAGGSGTALMMVFAYVFTPLRVMVGFRAWAECLREIQNTSLLRISQYEFNCWPNLKYYFFIGSLRPHHQLKTKYNSTFKEAENSQWL